jgi:(+)-trans-carveol dehydrogenase
MIENGEGGAIVLIGSGSSAIGFKMIGHYNAAKHGVIGLMKTLANELAPHRIRANAVSPSAVNTPMIMNEKIFSQFAGGRSGATIDDAMPALRAQNVLPNPWVEPEDISNAVVFLASDEGRYITGVDLPVDSGTRVQPAGMPPSALE